MGEDRTGRWPDSEMNNPETAEQRRLQTLCRQLFRDVVRHEINEGALSAYRRRLLVRYGVSLGLDELESALIVRGVEHECGQAGSDEVPDPTNPPDHGYLIPVDTRQSRYVLALVLLTGILLGLTLLSLR